LNNAIDPFWKNRNVFVTGCTGFLGSWLCRRLLKLGANVTGLVRDWVPGSGLVQEGSLRQMNGVRGEVEDYLLMERILGEYEVDTVFHLAAQTIVGIANRNPLSTFHSNILGTCSLLEACRRSPLVSRVIVASSDKAYGDPASLPCSEDSPLQGSTPYDVSKSCADLIARSYHNTYGLGVCITRCGNFFGGGDLNFNRIVPGTIRSALEGRPVEIRSDGTFTRNYLYVEDGVQAYLTLARQMDRDDVRGQAFNFSIGEPISVIDLVGNILGLMSCSLKPRILGLAQSEIRHQRLSTEKAKRLLGWQPGFSLDEALQKTIDWYRDYLIR
jgi:CDP-glucose 4,6-dehydratase